MAPVQDISLDNDMLAWYECVDVVLECKDEIHASELTDAEIEGRIPGLNRNNTNNMNTDDEDSEIDDSDDEWPFN